MASLTTALIGMNQQTLAPGPVGNAAADQVLIINLDLENTVNLGSSSTNLAFPLGPLASATLTAPVYAAAATVPLVVGIAPGGASYSPGSLTITGPVTAEITGPVTVEGTVSIGGTPTVDIGNTPAVTISGTPTVDIGTVSGSIDINSVAGNVNVDGVGGVFPPGAYTSVINDASGHTILFGGSYTTPVFSVQPYQSYSLAVAAYCSTQGAAGAPLVQPVVINWYADSAGTILLETDLHWMWLASTSGSGTACPLVGGGPARGAYASVTFTSMAANAATVIVSLIAVNGNGRSMAAAKFCQTVPVITSGVTVLPTVNPAVLLPGYPNAADGIVANETQNGNTAASSTYWFPLPLFAGTVSVLFSTTAALSNSFVIASAAGICHGQVVAGGAALGTQWIAGNTANTEYTTTLTPGNCPLYAVIHSTATAPVISLQVQGTPS